MLCRCRSWPCAVTAAALHRPGVAKMHSIPFEYRNVARRSRRVPKLSERCQEVVKLCSRNVIPGAGSRPDFGRVSPMCAVMCRVLADVDTVLAKFDPNWPTWPDVGRHRSDSAQISKEPLWSEFGPNLWPTFVANMWPDKGPTRPELAGTQSKFGRRCNLSTSCEQLLNNKATSRDVGGAPVRWLSDDFSLPAVTGVSKAAGNTKLATKPNATDIDLKHYLRTPERFLSKVAYGISNVCNVLYTYSWWRAAEAANHPNIARTPLPAALASGLTLQNCSKVARRSNAMAISTRRPAESDQLLAFLAELGTTSTEFGAMSAKSGVDDGQICLF